MKIIVLLAASALASACSSVWTYDANDRLIGRCVVRSFLNFQSNCVGSATPMVSAIGVK